MNLSTCREHNMEKITLFKKLFENDVCLWGQTKLINLKNENSKYNQSSSIARKCIIHLLMVIISGLAFSSRADKPYEYKPADASQIKNQGSESVMIMPATFLREYDPVTIMYNRDLHPEGSGPLDNPDQFVTIKPAHPGEYRWLDQRTLEFRPTVPWQPMQTYTVKAMGVTKTLTALLIPPQNITPASGSTGLDPVSRIALEFSQTVQPEILAKLVTFEACPLPGIETKNCRSYGSQDYTIKVSERSSKNAYIYWFIFKKPISNGLRIRTIVRLAADPALTDAKRIYFFDTRKEFTVERAGSYEYQFTLNPTGSTYRTRSGCAFVK